MKERRDYMFTLVVQWRDSGLTRKEFCLQHGITLSKFGYWIARWKEGQSGGIAVLYRWALPVFQAIQFYPLFTPTACGWRSPRPTWGCCPS